MSSKKDAKLRNMQHPLVGEPEAAFYSGYTKPTELPLADVRSTRATQSSRMGDGRATRIKQTRQKRGGSSRKVSIASSRDPAGLTGLKLPRF